MIIFHVSETYILRRKIMSKKTTIKIERKTNPRIKNLIFLLKEIGYENNSKLWLSISKKLINSSKSYSSLNLSKINRYTKENDIIVVPGKILGSGELSHSLTIGALGCSFSALNKIKSVNAEYISIEEMIKKNPSGKGIKIFK